ncbi:unnamed protein product [Gordionus sp. m RMFG-2023]
METLTSDDYRSLDFVGVNSSKESNKNETTQSSPQLILKVESTVVNILKTFDLDCSKNMEPILEVMCHTIIKNNLDIILLVAVNTDTLPVLFRKLIRFLEYSKEALAEGSKSSNSRALLYDISFLILIHIIQTYGIQCLESFKDPLAGNKTGNIDITNSFFHTWCRYFMAIPRYQSIDAYKLTNHQDPFKHRDKNKVEAYLSMFLAPNFDFKTMLMKWNDLSCQIPYVFYELFLALKQGVVNKETLFGILDKIKQKVFSLTICIFVWTRFYLPIIDIELYEYVKGPLLEYFRLDVNPPKGESRDAESNNCSKNESTANTNFFMNETNHIKISFQDRWLLTKEIVSTMDRIIQTQDHEGKKIKDNKQSHHQDYEYLFQVIKNGSEETAPYENIINKWKTLYSNLNDPQVARNLIQPSLLSELFDSIMKEAHFLNKVSHLHPTKPGGGVILDNCFLDFFNNEKDQIIGICSLDFRASALYFAHTYHSWLTRKDMKRVLMEPFSHFLNDILISVVSSAFVYLQCSSLDNPIQIYIPEKILNHYSYKHIITTSNPTNEIVMELLDFILKQLCQTFANIISTKEIDSSSSTVLNFLLKISSLDKDTKNYFLKHISHDLIKNTLDWFPQYFTEEIIFSLYDINDKKGLERTSQLLYKYYQNLK